MYLLLIYSGSEETRKLLGVVAVRLQDEWLGTRGVGSCRDVALLRLLLSWELAELGVSSYEETLE